MPPFPFLTPYKNNQLCITYLGIYTSLEYALYMANLESKYGPAYEALERNLREARKLAGLTQAEAAQRLGKPQSFISKCESGERRIDIIELRVLAKLYGKDLSFFLRDLP